MKLKIEPRMLDKATAAGYCGVTAATFAAACPVRAVVIGGAFRYDRKELDAWLDRLSTGGRATKAEILARLDE